MDITALILDDHQEQRRLFAMLEQVGATDAGALTALWGRLAAFLEVHAEAEERLFYPALLRGLDQRRLGDGGHPGGGTVPLGTSLQTLTGASLRRSR